MRRGQRGGGRLSWPGVQGHGLTEELGERMWASLSVSDELL
jgi:hypothetical protein